MFQLSMKGPQTIYRLYTIFLILASPLLAILLVVRLLRGKSREGWAERWGHIEGAGAPKRARRIWLHGASVGEFMAAMPIIKAYKQLQPDDEIWVSVITPGGHEVASNEVGKLVTRVFYAPFDLPFAVRRAVRAVQPDVFIGMETELWPVLLHHAKASGARMLLANARISDRSIGKYRKLTVLMRWVLSNFDNIIAQTPLDAQRLEQIGADPGKISQIGNAKFDEVTERTAPDEVTALRATLKLNPEAPVFIIASTRSADEERLAYSAYAQAREVIPELVLIHAPRHIDRADEVCAMLREMGMSPVRKTAIESAQPPVQQLILDTFGELSRVYSVCDVAFVGNSLTPPGGGQNVIQALAQGKPVIFGPYMQNSRDIAAMTENAGVGFRVNDARQLADRVIALLNDPEGRHGISEAAERLLAANRGAAMRYARMIQGVEPERVPANPVS